MPEETRSSEDNTQELRQLQQAKRGMLNQHPVGRSLARTSVIIRLPRTQMSRYSRGDAHWLELFVCLCCSCQGTGGRTKQGGEAQLHKETNCNKTLLQIIKLLDSYQNDSCSLQHVKIWKDYDPTISFVSKYAKKQRTDIPESLHSLHLSQLYFALALVKRGEATTPASSPAHSRQAVKFWLCSFDEAIFPMTLQMEDTPYTNLNLASFLTPPCGIGYPQSQLRPKPLNSSRSASR